MNRKKKRLTYGPNNARRVVWARFLRWLGFCTGNPGVFRRNPYPNPSLPVPWLWGTGLSVMGLRVSMKYIYIIIYLILHYIIT